jgi:DNA-binding XRE family transcriptional regulator
MTVQIIKQGDKPEWAVVPYDVYIQLVDKAEMAQDIQDYDSAKAALNHGEDELIPSEIIYAILDGANPIKTWREFRGKSQQEMADEVGISIPYLSQLETNKRKGSRDVLSVIAKVLRVSLDQIVPSQS